MSRTPPGRVSTNGVRWKCYSGGSPSSVSRDRAEMSEDRDENISFDEREDSSDSCSSVSEREPPPIVPSDSGAFPVPSSIHLPTPFRSANARRQMEGCDDLWDYVPSKFSFISPSPGLEEPAPLPPSPTYVGVIALRSSRNFTLDSLLGSTDRRPANDEPGQKAFNELVRKQMIVSDLDCYTSDDEQITFEPTPFYTPERNLQSDSTTTPRKTPKLRDCTPTPRTSSAVQFPSGSSSEQSEPASSDRFDRSPSDNAIASDSPWDYEGFTHMVIRWESRNSFLMLDAQTMSCILIGMRQHNSRDRFLMWPPASPSTKSITMKLVREGMFSRKYALYYGGADLGNHQDTTGALLPVEQVRQPQPLPNQEETPIISSFKLAKKKLKNKLAPISKSKSRKACKPLLRAKIQKLTRQTKVTSVASLGSDKASSLTNVRMQTRSHKFRNTSGKRRDKDRILELADHNGHVALYLTKRQKGVFRLDFTSMFAPCQAFSVALTQFD